MRPCLPQHDPRPDRRAQRLAAVRDELPIAWDRPEGVATAADIPRRLGFPGAVLLQVTEARALLAANRAAVRLLRGKEDPAAPSDLERCRQAFATVPVPGIAEVAHGPDADRVFAWQRLGGANPFVLRRVDGPGDLALDEIPEGPLFVADYPELAGLPAGSWEGVPKWLGAPTALFVGGRDGLRPLAIRTAPGAPVVRPADGLPWEVARTVVQAADANLQESFFHLGRAHFLLEAVALATERQLSDAHPLYALLAPHLEGTLAINGSARDDLVVPGGDLDRLLAPSLDGSLDLVRLALQTFRLDEALPPADLARRGLDDRDALPVHPWRDDALPLWELLRRFVADVLALAYPSEQDLRDDVELAAWAGEIRSPDGGRLAGFPRPETLEQLTDAVTFVIFQASAGHAAVNYTQEDFLAWVPNMPTATYAAPSGATLEALLPRCGQADAQIDFMVQQSRVRVNRLGDYAHHLHDPRAEAPLARLASDLEALERDIDAREAARLLPYPYLRPSLLTASIHI